MMILGLAGTIERAVSDMYYMYKWIGYIQSIIMSISYYYGLGHG